jgi:hypothetical protein
MITWNDDLRGGAAGAVVGRTFFAACMTYNICPELAEQGSVVCDVRRPKRRTIHQKL